MVRINAINKMIVVLAAAVIFASLVCFALSGLSAKAQEDTVAVSINSYRKTRVEDRSVGDKIYLDTPVIPEGYTFAGWSDGVNLYPSQTELEITSAYIEDGLNLKAIYEPIKVDNTLYIIIGSSVGGLTLIVLILAIIIIKRRKRALQQERVAQE